VLAVTEGCPALQVEFTTDLRSEEKTRLAEVTIQANQIETVPIQSAARGTDTSADRSRRPVFVIGCHRSGTNLLYDMLLSSGDFAIYRGQLPVYKLFLPKFGSLDKRGNMERAVDTWLHSKGYRRSGLKAKEIRAKLLEARHSAGDFMRTVMNEIASNQNARRWAIYDPDGVLYMQQIKADIPEALFIHIVRDGRDIALSLKKMEGFKPLPWDIGSSRGLLATAAYWKWMVRTGQTCGRTIPADYMEVRYEDLVQTPHETLAALGRFLDHDLDYERIQKAGLGRLSETNSSFREEGAHSGINPVQRWKERLSHDQVAALEALVGDCLEEHGYELATPLKQRKAGLHGKWIRAFYPALLGAKQWLKTRTPLGKLANLSVLELSDVVPETSVVDSR